MTSAYAEPVVMPGWPTTLPTRWPVTRLRHVSKIYAGGTPDRSNDAYWEGGTIPWLSSGEVNQGLITEPTTFMTPAALANSSARWIPRGSLVMALAGQGKTKGMVAQLGIAATCNQSLAAIVADRRVHSRYLMWWLTAHYEVLRNLAGGELRDGLNLDIIGDIPCPLPPLAEQTAIADYLDRETAGIDALIAAKQRMLELLKERVQAQVDAAINEAPGLRTRLGHLVDILPGYAFPSETFLTTAERGSVRLLRGINVSPGTVLWDDTVYLRAPLPSDVVRFALRAGDIVLGMDRPIISSGLRLAEIAEDDLPALLVQRVARIRPSSRSSGNFLRYALSTTAFKNHIDPITTGVSVPHISEEQIASFRVPSPPLSVQQNISRRLITVKHSAQRAMAMLGNQITLLVERRQATITAAVAGGLMTPEVAV